MSWWEDQRENFRKMWKESMSNVYYDFVQYTPDWGARSTGVWSKDVEEKLIKQREKLIPVGSPSGESRLHRRSWVDWQYEYDLTRLQLRNAFEQHKKQKLMEKEKITRDEIIEEIVRQKKWFENKGMGIGKILMTNEAWEIWKVMDDKRILLEGHGYVRVKITRLPEGLNVMVTGKDKPKPWMPSPLMDYALYKGSPMYLAGIDPKEPKDEAKRKFALMVEEIKRKTMEGYHITDVIVNPEIYNYMMVEAGHPLFGLTVCWNMGVIKDILYGSRRIAVTSVTYPMENGYRLVTLGSAKPKTDDELVDASRFAMTDKPKEEPPVNLLEHCKEMRLCQAPAYWSKYKSKREIIQTDRRVGNTTRMVDEAIQLLFEGKRVKIVDHFDNKESHKRVVDLILARWKAEHAPMTLDALEFDKANNVFQIIKNVRKTEQEKFIKKVQTAINKAKFDGNPMISVLVNPEQNVWLLEAFSFFKAGTVASSIYYDGVTISIFIKDKLFQDLTK